MQDEEKGEAAKMDLALWMQEDGTGIFGSLIFAMDIFDAATIHGMAKCFVVRKIFHADEVPKCLSGADSAFVRTRPRECCAEQPSSSLYFCGSAADSSC